MRDQRGFFDVDERLKRLSDLGDQLEVFQSAVDFEMFRPQLNAVLSYSDGSQGGRPPFDPVMMFKILVIQAVNDLSDERTEFLINDRLSFMRFLGLSLSDRVPDARTIWLFREKLTKAGAIRGLFERFDATLRAAGYIAMSGQIVDASLIAAPKQRNTQEEKKAIKEGRIPKAWKDKPAKLRQKDRDARWTVKFVKAKQREDGSSPRSSAIKTMFRSIAALASSANGAQRTPRPMKAADCARGCLTRRIRRAAFGRIRPIDRPPTRRSWRRMALSAMSIARSQRAAPCRKRCDRRMPPNRKSAPASSMCLPSRRSG
jgi:transposase